MSEPASDSTLETKVRQVLAEEKALVDLVGGPVDVVSVQQGVVKVSLARMGICCPGRIASIVSFLEIELRRRFPGIDFVEATV